jgi:hemolysin III
MEAERKSDHSREPFYTPGEEITHAITHGLGLLLSIAGLAVLVVAASVRGDVWHLVGCAVFGVTLILLYAASTLYHSVRHPRAKRVLRHFDHAAVYLLIAGSYTPFTLVSLRGGWGWTLLALVWGLAILGITLQVTRPSGLRHASVPLYLVMGWLVVIAIEPLVRSLHSQGLVLLILGGLAYTLGLVFYAWRRLPYNHAVWHLFVLAGSACHFTCVLGYVIPPAA